MANPPQIIVDEYSIKVTPLLMHFGPTHISTGTAFFWEHGNQAFLVTNWHNITGKDPVRNVHLSPTGAEPDRLVFYGYRDRNLSEVIQIQANVRDSSGDPVWLEHPTHGRGVDVVCLPLQQDMLANVFPVNVAEPVPLSTRIADEVFILGYPLGVGPERLPIWKRASVATEIDIDVDHLPRFLVDTASAPGMSGAPVIRRAHQGVMEDGSTAVFAGGPAARFIGIYSGRFVTGGPIDAQLGIVWKAKVIKEILAGQKRGPKP